jgi:hypothetical protein
MDENTLYLFRIKCQYQRDGKQKPFKIMSIAHNEREIKEAMARELTYSHLYKSTIISIDRYGEVSFPYFIESK